MIVKENELDMIRIVMKLLADASYNRGKLEMNLTHQDFEKWRNAHIEELLNAADTNVEELLNAADAHQDFEKWRNAHIEELLNAANIKSEESNGGCENGACTIHYKD